MYSEESIAALKEKVSIKELVERYTELKPRGRDYWGCCPFHKEKTPSFKVAPEKGTWYCFGCQEGGDAIDFVMKIENLGFSEAAEKLASKVGATLKKRDW